MLAGTSRPGKASMSLAGLCRFDRSAVGPRIVLFISGCHNLAMDSETHSLDGVLKLLKFRQKHDLAQLLERAWLELDESNQYGSYLFSTLTTARIHAPIDDYHRLRALPNSAKDEVLSTLLEIYP